ncbi:MAG: peptidoglycan-associated lipoprotein Pal [Burkholderiaceae bacterium]
MKWIAVAASLAVLAGCASKPQQAVAPAPAPAAAPAPAPAPVAPPRAAAATPAPSPVSQAVELARSRIIGVEPSVYFDFDQFTIKPDFQNTVSAFGNYLAVVKGSRMVIEGNADERGTVEYNLALGQRRAEAVSMALQVNGASPASIETISYGEERPRNPGKSEAAFAENRRADLVLK